MKFSRNSSCSQSISYITITPFCISQNTDIQIFTATSCRHAKMQSHHRLQDTACLANAANPNSYKQPYQWRVGHRYFANCKTATTMEIAGNIYMSPGTFTCHTQPLAVAVAVAAAAAGGWHIFILYKTVKNIMVGGVGLGQSQTFLWPYFRGRCRTVEAVAGITVWVLV